MNDDQDREDPTTEARLRRVLHQEAEMIQPTGDGLSRIRERTGGSPWWRPAVAGIGVAAVVGAGVGVGLAITRGTDDDATTTTAQPAASATPTASSAVVPAGPSASTPTAANGMAVPLYWLGGSGPAGSGPRLYREFRRVTAPSTASSAAETALRAVLGTAPTDPDYRTAWPHGTTVRTVGRSGDTEAVDLTGAARSKPAQPALAVQQLVYTVTAADPTITGLRILIDGTPLSTVWGAGSPGAVAVQRAAQLDVLAPVWLTSPAEATTSGSPLRLDGQATVFEATVSWEVLNASGQQTAKGFATASEGAPGRGTWSASVDLPAGTYTVRAFESSAKDGSILWPDTKTVTIRG